MSMIRTLAAATLALALAGAPAVGDAQTPTQAPTPPAAQAQRGEAVGIGADDGVYTAEGFSLRGRAEVTQGQNRLRADAINGIGSGSRISRIEASGNVYFVTPQQTIRGDRAVYTVANDEVVVTGDVILTQGQNVLTGGRLTYNTRTETARMEGASGGRIRGVFYPDSN